MPPMWKTGAPPLHVRAEHLFVCGPDWFDWPGFLFKTLDRLTFRYDAVETIHTGSRRFGQKGVDYYAMKWAAGYWWRRTILYVNDSREWVWKAELTDMLVAESGRVVCFRDTDRKCQQTTEIMHMLRGKLPESLFTVVEY